ncbi:MAG: ABC transporter permease [Planctomycetota bacterium]
MLRPRTLWQLSLAQLREFWRSREAVVWSYAFPVLMAVVLGLAFGRRGPLPPSRVVVVASAQAASLRAALQGVPALEVRVLDGDAAQQAYAEGRAELLLSGSPTAPALRVDPLRPESELAQRRVADALQRGAGREDPLAIAIEEPAGGAHGYVERLIPGLIGLNLLGAGLWGVGFNLVDMRAKHLLRRLVVAPMGRAEFLLALLLSRLGLVVINSCLILLFGIFTFDLTVQGAWPLLFGVFALSGAVFSGLGLAVASRPRTIEGVSGVMNLAMLPQWLLCGSFFDVSNFPAYFQPLVQLLPLTHVNAALRGVILDGHGIVGIGWELAYLVGFTLLSFFLALRFFRWT